MTKKLPPYLRNTRACKGKDGRVIIDGWSIVQAERCHGDLTRMTAVMPTDNEPDAFDWRPFKGRDVLVSFYADEHRPLAHGVAVELLIAGARMALTVDHVGATAMNVYRPQPAGGARG